MVDFSKYKIIEDEKEKGAGERLPPVYSTLFHKLWIAYNNIVVVEQKSGDRNDLINIVVEYCSVAPSTAINYVRMLEIMGFMDNSEKIILKKRFEDIHTFFIYYREKLKELFLPIIQIIKGNNVLNYKEISKLAFDKGYQLSPLKARRIFSLLRGAGILTISKTINIIEQRKSDEIILEILKKNGPLEIKNLKRKIRDMNKDTFKESMITLIEGKQLRIKTYPRALKMLSKVCRQIEGKDTSIDFLIGGIWKKSKIIENLIETYNLSQEDANEMISWLGKDKSELISVEKDRLRKKYVGKEIPTFVSVHKFWLDTDIIEVI